MLQNRALPRTLRRTVAPAASLETALFKVGAAALGAVGVTWTVAMFDAWMKSEPPKIYSQHSSDMTEVLSRCPKLTQGKYKPFPFMTNPHFETIFAALFRKGPRIDYRREILVMQDTGCVALDWENDRSKALPADAPVLVLLPGLTGGSGDTYILHAVEYASERGFRTLVFNSRGTADSPVTTPQYYSASFTGDMKEVMRHVQNLFPSAPVSAMGWSLGANVLVNYVSEMGEDCPLFAAVSLCNPFQLMVSMENIQMGFNKFYDARLAASLARIHNKHLDKWQGVGGKFRPEDAAKCKTIREFDDCITIHSFGFPSTEEYYNRSSSANAVPNVRRRCLCVQALDDPIAPRQAIPYEALAENPCTVLVTTRFGGHLGWVAGEGAPFGRPWTNDVAFEFLASALLQWQKDREGVQVSGFVPGDEEATPVGHGADALVRVMAHAVAGVSDKDKAE